MNYTWSYSSISLFQQCPRKYHRLRVVKDIVEPVQEHLLYGSAVHKAAEEYIRDGTPIPEKYGFIQEYLDPLKDEAPAGWYVTGYPWYAIATPEHKRFLDAYQAKFKDYPRQGSVVGYSMIQALAAGIGKAGSTDTEKLITAFRGLSFGTPFGKVMFRGQDHQSTMGAFLGRTQNDGGKGVMVDYRYIDGARVQPSDADVKKMRPAD